jgi:hypothetical protein
MKNSRKNLKFWIVGGAITIVQYYDNGWHSFDSCHNNRFSTFTIHELHVIFNEIFKYCEPEHIANLTLNYELSINPNIKLILLE